MNFNKRKLDFKKVFFLLAFFYSAHIQSQDQKNILLIYVDDLKPFIGSFGDNVIHTPNIDSLAKHSTVFLNASCQQAICSPSRASMLTGKYPDEISIYGLSTPIRKKNPNIKTLPQYFKENGYTTAGVGKIFHSGSVDEAGDSISWTVDFDENPIEYYHKTTGSGFNGYHDPEVKNQFESFQQYLYDNDIIEPSEINKALKLFPLAKPSTENLNLPDDAYKDGATTKYALDQLQQLDKNNLSPFFLAVGFNKPHLPFVAPSRYWELYDREEILIDPFQERDESIPSFAFNSFGELRKQYSDTSPSQVVGNSKQKKLIHGYRASVSFIDAQVGLLTRQLIDLGLADKTIIVLVGDHGYHLGDHGQWAKHSLFEQAVRTPLIIYDPDVSHTSTNFSEVPVELIDIFPTLIDLNHLPIYDELSGSSLGPTLINGDSSIKEVAMSQYPRKVDGQPAMGYSLRNNRYRYTRWIQIDYLNGQRCGELLNTELYDYDVDPFERVNLAKDEKYQKVVMEFEQLFKERKVAQSPDSTPNLVDVTACNSYPFGEQNLTVSGLYSASFRSEAGCDSLVSLNLIIADSISNDIIEENSSLIASEESALYQWIDCDNNNTPLSGEINRCFSPTQSGNYAVEISNGICTEISDCVSFNFELVLSNNSQLDPEISVYPNPVSNSFRLDLGKKYAKSSIKLFSIDGKCIQSKSSKNSRYIDVEVENSKGVYFLHAIIDQDIKKVIPIIKR